MAEKTKAATAAETNIPEATERVDLEKMKAEAMAEVKAEIKAMLDAAKIEAAEIVASAQKPTNPMSQEKTEAEKEEEAYWNEKVKIRLFKDSKKYSDDVFVGHNGVGYLIQRGKDIGVPRFIAHILANQEEQDNKTSDLMQQLQDDFKRADAKVSE